MASKRSPIVEFNYDISCPFAYIASTRIEALAARAGAELIWSPVLLGAIYRQTAAPQGAAGSASDVFNPAKKNVSSQAFARTIKRYKVPFNQPKKHPQKTTSALRLLYSISNEERPTLTKFLFRAYWVDDKDISDPSVLLNVARQSGIANAGKLSEASFSGSGLDEALRTATADAVARGAPGVPSFWIPGEKWTDFEGKACQGRLYWGQDRMQFVEAVLVALKQGIEYDEVPDLVGLQPRCLWVPKQKKQTKVEFWYDFSSPWAFLGWTQLERMKRETSEAGLELQIDMKPMLLGGLFREIGAPMLPMMALSPQKRAYTRNDQADWVRHWNAINSQQNHPDEPVKLRFPDVFPIRSPLLLRIAMIEPKTIPVLFRASWSENINVSNPETLTSHLSASGFTNAADLLKTASSSQQLKDRLRANNDEALRLGLCGAPTYRVLERTNTDKDGEGEGWTLCSGGQVWGQDELATVQDLIAGWREDEEGNVADVSSTHQKGGVSAQSKARL